MIHGLYVLAAVSIGAFGSLQPAINAAMSRILGSPFLAAVVSATSSQYSSSEVGTAYSSPFRNAFFQAPPRRSVIPACHGASELVVWMWIPRLPQ